MKKPIHAIALRLGLAAVFVLIALLAQPGQAQPSQYMTYQGYLTDGNGNPLGTTNTGPKAYDIVFRIWDVSTGGTPSDELHAEVQTVTVDNGYFSVLMGQGLRYLSEPFASPLSSVFTNATAARYLEMTVQGIGVGGANITILPRLQLVSSPYSFLAANAQNVTGNGVITSANIAQSTITGGNIASQTIAGANIAPGTIQGANIAAGTITGAKIASSTVTGANIAGQTIAGGNIANQTITYQQIANNTITASQMDASVATWANNGGNAYRNAGGSVGIGTANPVAILDVEGIAEPAGGVSGPYFYALGGQNFSTFGANTTEYISIKSQWYVLGYGFIAMSDQRIKDIIGESDHEKDLDTIMRLKVTDYRMKDRLGAGDKVHKGFIAQEVQKVIPEAVNKGRDFIPNIYVEATNLAFDAATHSLRLDLNKAHELKQGDKVRLIEEGATIEREVSQVPTENSFVVGEIGAAPKRVFVFGKQVDDFLSVDYDRIYSTGIGAIQDLAVRVEKLESHNDAIADLEKKAARVDALEEEVADLKRAVAQLADAQANKGARQSAEAETHVVPALSRSH